MAYELDDRLVVGVASSALFDLTESDAVFNDQGEQAYRDYQERLIDEPLGPGVAFPFIQRLLGLNDLSESTDNPLVEVIVLSRNSPDTGLRVMRSVQAHKLPITRAVFMEGRAPYQFIPAFNMALFLSRNADDVRNATQAGFPAGQVLPSAAPDDGVDRDLRIAFDFDGVLADDASERVYQDGDLPAFVEHETEHVIEPHNPGPLMQLLGEINRIQRIEDARFDADRSYRKRVHVSIVTARNAPAHERAVRSLKSWGVTVNDAFFLGGIEKARVLKVLRPHVFFDDQLGHLEGAASIVPSVHVPFGIRNN